jgi:hypothetical protein
MDRRGMRVGVAVMAAALEVAAMVFLGLTETHHDILGTTGAIAVLIAVIAAVLWLRKRLGGYGAADGHDRLVGGLEPVRANSGRRG